MRAKGGAALCWAEEMQAQSPSQPLQLWRAFPADLRDARVLAECCALLSEEEQARARRFRFDRDRCSFAAGRALARAALSQAHTLAPREWRLITNAHGKPAAEPDCGLRFNIANSEDLAVCLLARGAEVGIDAEPFAVAAQIAEIAPKIFSQQELAQLEALRDAERERRALSLWVLKEAYGKACGRGLGLPLKKFSFLFENGGAIRLTMEPELGDRPDRWRFTLLDCAGHRVALMVEDGLKEWNSAARGLEMWEARPPHASGAKLEELTGLRWHEGGA